MLVREPRVQPPPLENYSDMPLYNTKAVVHHTGVPAPTLRAWERRYGILSPRRGENDYRLYSERDMAVIAWLRERVESGMTISQAIALLRSLEPGRRRGRRKQNGATAAEVALPAAEPSVPGTYALSELVMALCQACARLNEVAATRIIAQALSVYPPEDVCLGLCQPVLAEIGTLWAEGKVSVTVEHFASALVRAQLESLFRSAVSADGGPLVLVGCAPGELHELGALMLALFLRRGGVRVVYLGQSVEVNALVATAAQARPLAVLLSAALANNVEGLREVGEQFQRLGDQSPLFYFGGQAFLAAPELAQQIPGQHLGMNALDAVQEIRRRVSA